MFHFICDYNCGNFRQILIIFLPLETGMNTKHVQTVSRQPEYVSALPGKSKNNTKTADCLLQCVLLNRLFGILFQTFAESRSVFISFPVVRKFF